LEFTNIIKATLVFKEESNSYPDYPHKLLVYLCLENRHDSSVYWYCNSVLDVETDLLDSNGKPVPQTGGFASVPSNAETYLLPYHSRLEWMLNHGGVTMLGEAKDKYALVVGSRSWLIPTNSFSSYSLRVRVRGWPWSDHAPPGAPRGKVFFEVPPTQLVIK
jgi:hypothetical protein